MFDIPEKPERFKGMNRSKAMDIIDKVASESTSQDFAVFRDRIYHIMHKPIRYNPHRVILDILRRFEDAYKDINNEELQKAINFLKWDAENPILEFE